ncbi:MAG TPA: DNA polymerase III subunit gamma/tau [Chitinophagaceae bacterium]|jgi:DNA polymerase-3 subunit gamma/tau|nr:DNA polymerase III subunit gamma/tau [Chitinophagaceae bacterium]
MDKFVVSARKYRPQTFDTVIGQAHITTTLKNAIKNNQLAHAFLFCGPRGVGKTTCARILAKTINCENRTADGEACNKCNSCISFNEGTSLNIHELDAASNNSVDDIRTLVDQVRFAPQAGKYKVYIIDEVHMLSSSAFNAFLKTLEEPPPYAIFILATTEKHKILPTILSRCQIFDFKRITLNDTIEHLQDICKKEEITADKTSLQLIAQKSEGCMRDALSILDKIVSFTNSEVNYQNTLEQLNILDADYYFRLTGCMQQQDLAGAMLLYDDINRKGFEGDMVLNGFSEFIRNLLVCKDEKSAELLEAVEGFRERYIETAKNISAGYLVSALNILNETEINYKAARNKRLHVELALIKLCYLQQAIELVNEENGISKKKIAEKAKPLAFRKIEPIELSRESGGKSRRDKVKLLIETSVQEGSSDYEKAEGTRVKKHGTSDGQLVTGNDQPATSDRQPAPKLAALDKIRSQMRGNGNGENGNVVKAIQPEELQQAWNEYAAQLKKEKNPAGQNFEMAELRVQDANSFIAIVSNNIQLRFIEQQGLKVSQFLREKLCNSQLQFYIVMQENTGPNSLTDTPLTSREQFQKMVEQYPLIKELKDKLRLELDY